MLDGEPGPFPLYFLLWRCFYPNMQRTFGPALPFHTNWVLTDQAFLEA